MNFTALENVCIPAFIGGVAKKEAERRLQNCYHMMNLSDRMTHKPSALSGGEQQRGSSCACLDQYRE